MGAIYGFQNYKGHRGTPRPEDVGQMLLQRQGTNPAQPMAEAEPDAADPSEMAEGEPDVHHMAAMTEWPSSAEAALRAAILRAPGQMVQSNPHPPAPGNRAQLQRLGLSDPEIDLLGQSGGANP